MSQVLCQLQGDMSRGFYADSTSRTNFLYVFKIFMILCPFMDTSTKMSGYLDVSLPIYDYLDVTMFVVSRVT